MKKGFFWFLWIPMDSFGLHRISRWTSWRIPDPWLSWRICLSPTVLRGLSTDIHQSKLLCGTYSWKTHGPLMNHSWRGGFLETPFLKKSDESTSVIRGYRLRFSVVNTHEALMTPSWTTHEPGLRSFGLVCVRLEPSLLLSLRRSRCSPRHISDLIVVIFFFAFS